MSWSPPWACQGLPDVGMLSPATLDNCAVRATLGSKMRETSVEPVTFFCRTSYLSCSRLPFPCFTSNRKRLRQRRISRTKPQGTSSPVVLRNDVARDQLAALWGLVVLAARPDRDVRKELEHVTWVRLLHAGLDLTRGLQARNGRPDGAKRWPIQLVDHRTAAEPTDPCAQKRQDARVVAAGILLDDVQHCAVVLRQAFARLRCGH